MRATGLPLRLRQSDHRHSAVNGTLWNVINQCKGLWLWVFRDGYNMISLLLQHGCDMIIFLAWLWHILMWLRHASGMSGMCWDHFAKFSFILLFMSVCEHPRAPIRIFTTTATDEKLSEYEHLSNLASVSFLKHQAFVNIGPPALGIGSNRSRDTDADSKRESLSQQKRSTPNKKLYKAM